ncbi:hypothetical protein [Planosporangium mesophilum]|uniref:Uncharacterized protein n=1 Tax=Planosporangium mesophilum TaxID=689768 RepID=A0A8J3X4R8_9ACTN|nr:hypothetical protein [Planosporangium mesophilum]NJC85441.1 hypothetical protein [Planosporangium mesophilum]GII24048.1 hypothetical protein Pme01_36450 [Planosporangium mesophilum]
MRLSLIAVLVCVVSVTALPGSSQAAAATPRIDLNVLVVTDGTPWVQAISQQLASEGVPTTVVDLSSPSRPVITGAFLSDTLAGGTPRAKFQGVVLPSDAPPGLSAAEQAAIVAFEQSFDVRQVDAYVYPGASVGLNPPFYAGSFDGSTTTATASARSDAFRYLNGPVTFEGSPGGNGSYGYLATPLPDNPTTGTHFEPYLTGSAPGATGTGTLAGVYTGGGRQQLVLTFAYNYYQQQYRSLAHGIVDWVTKGVHLGYWRNYFTTHIDDIFSSDSRWSDVGKCTPGEGDCAAAVPATTPIRMVPADVTNAASWQVQHNYTLDLLYNGDGSVQAGGSADPLTGSLLANKALFRWLNHTYSHPFLGCVQDFTVIPWRCRTDASGNTVWTDRATVDNEIAANIQFARSNGLPIRANELVSGEHSGTRILPQQTADNPNFVNAVTQNGIGWLGLDASREPAQRQIGSALGVPRHPINVFFNVATAREEVSEYNWIYTSKADGGSGICEANPTTTTCIAPLDPATGWSQYILPLQVQITLGYVLSNDPRPFYMHQSNLTEDRLALQAIGGILAAYRRTFATNTPVVSQTMTDAGTALRRQAVWAQTLSARTVSGYVQGNTMTLTGPAGTNVPVTAPAGTTDGWARTFGSAYAGEQSGYVTLGSSATTLKLPARRASEPLLSLRITIPLTVRSAGSPVTATVNGAAVTITSPAGRATLPRLAATGPSPVQPPPRALRQPQHRTTAGG